MNLDFSNEIESIRENGITDKVLAGILKKFEPMQTKLIHMQGRYEANDEVPVFGRSFKDSNKVNNKVNNDFFSEIIDIKTGYFAGNPFTYNYTKDDDGYERAMERLDRFITLNSLPDLDSEATKTAGVGGYSARLLYIDPQGQERVMNVLPSEAIILSEQGITDPEYGIRVYSVPTERGTKRRLEVYDAAGMRVFLERKKGVFDELVDEYPAGMDMIPHTFGVCPLYGIPNNEELQGDAEKVLPLIDAYDRTLSDVNSEIESFRLAYMLFKGGYIDEDVLREAQRTGAFSVPEDGEISYLTKQMSDTIVENHLNRLEQNIYKFSKTPNLSGDEAFAGNQSGVSLKFKLFPLESKCKTFERKFDAAQRHMFTALANSWRIKGDDLDPLGFFVEYKRNFPLDLLFEAQVQAALKGLVSEQTRLGLASFIDDVDYEMELMEAEADDLTFDDADDEEALAAAEAAAAVGAGAAPDGQDGPMGFVTE